MFHWLIFCISVVFSVPINIHGFVSLNLLFHDQGGRVLVLGDCHQSAIDDMNNKHINTLVSYLNSINDKVISTGKTPARAFFELSQEIMDLYKAQAIPFGTRIAQTMKRLIDITIEQQADKPSCVIFDPYEPRGNDSGELDGIFETLRYQIREQSLQSTLSLLRPALVNVQRKSGIVCSIGNYFNGLEQGAQLCQSWCREFDDNSPINTLLSQLSQEFIRAKDEAKGYFAGKDLGDSLVMALLDILDHRAGNGGNGLLLIKEMHSALILKLDYLYAHIAFFHKIMEDQKVSQSGKTMLIVGAAHAEAIVKMLKEVGYKSILENKLYVGNLIGDGQYGVSMNDSVFIDKLLFAITALFEDNGEKLYALAKNPKEYIPCFCNSCGIVESEAKKLLKCSRCKARSYCGVPCQKQDWPKHKEICKRS
jgi:MYND finger